MPIVSKELYVHSLVHSDAGVATVLGAVDDGGADWVEVDVDQAGDQRSLVE